MVVKFSAMPVQGPITQPFGLNGHRGIDIGVYNKPVVAPASGVACSFTNSWVMWKGQLVKSFGEAVCIDHGAEHEYRYTLYAHLSETHIQIGDSIKAGDIIGITGNTGVSTGGHLHWQLCKLSTFPAILAYSADPLLYMEDDMTRDEIEALIKEKVSEGDLVSSTTVLSTIAQIVGAEENTYSDIKKIEEVRKAIRDLAGAGKRPVMETSKTVVTPNNTGG